MKKRAIVSMSIILSVLLNINVFGQTLYPTNVDITKFNEKDAIIKTYEVDKDSNFSENKEIIKFDDENYIYLDTFKNSLTDNEVKSHNHKIEKKNKGDFSDTFLYEDINGWKGVLTLDKQSITPINVRYSTYTNTITKNRTYPNLYANDLSLIPKSIVENGTTYNFSSVNWVDDTVFDIDSQSVTQTYTANVTYSGNSVGKKSSADGYYAIYSGEITRQVTNVDEYKVVYIKGSTNEIADVVTDDLETTETVDITDTKDVKHDYAEKGIEFISSILKYLSKGLLMILMILIIIYFLMKIKSMKPLKPKKSKKVDEKKDVEEVKPLVIKEESFISKVKKQEIINNFTKRYKSDERDITNDEDEQIDIDDTFEEDDILNADDIDEDIY